MTPAEIAKLIPRAVIRGAIEGAAKSGWIVSDSEVRAALAAGLAAWKTKTHRPVVGKAVDEVDVIFPALILPLPRKEGDA